MVSRLEFNSPLEGFLWCGFAWCLVWFLYDYVTEDYPDIRDLEVKSLFDVKQKKLGRYAFRKYLKRRPNRVYTNLTKKNRGRLNH
jgi:hypothetical protein